MPLTIVKSHSQAVHFSSKYVWMDANSLFDSTMSPCLALLFCTPSDELQLLESCGPGMQGSEPLAFLSAYTIMSVLHIRVIIEGKFHCYFSNRKGLVFHQPTKQLRNCFQTFPHFSPQPQGVILLPATCSLCPISILCDSFNSGICELYLMIWELHSLYFNVHAALSHRLRVTCTSIRCQRTLLYFHGGSYFECICPFVQSCAENENKNTTVSAFHTSIDLKRVVFFVYLLFCKTGGVGVLCEPNKKSRLQLF